jgi:hypothetical protein
MTVKVTINEIIHLDCFKSLLQKYRDFTSCYREIKINCITGKKSQLEISEMNPPIVCGFETHEPSNYNVFRVKDSCFTVNSINLIVNSKLEVIDVFLQIRILDTDNGKLLNDILEQVQFRTYNLRANDKITEIYGFYAASTLKLSA